MSKVQHGSKLYILWNSEIWIQVVMSLTIICTLFLTPLRPIPSEIVTEELDKLIAVLEAMSNDTTLLKKWYRKDTNKVCTFNLYQLTVY